jgi:hypothetical protein
VTTYRSAPADDPGVFAGVAAATLAVPGVTGRRTGSFSEVATHLPGRRVEGVRLRADGTEVHVVLGTAVDVLVLRHHGRRDRPGGWADRDVAT